jgi:branched-chain amino acid transport system ATP-binding protein
MAILDIRNCTKRFGGLVAVCDLNMSLATAISMADWTQWRGEDDSLQPDPGVYTPDEGSIELDGKSISGRKAIVTSRISECRGLFRTSGFLRA